MDILFWTNFLDKSFQFLYMFSSIIILALNNRHVTLKLLETSKLSLLLDPHIAQLVSIPNIAKWIKPEVVPENLKMGMLKIDWLTPKQYAYAKMENLIMDHLDSAIPKAAHIYVLKMENPNMALLPYMVTQPDMHSIAKLFAVATEINWPLLLMDYITKYGNLMSVLKFTKNGNLLFLMDDKDPCDL